MKTQKQLAAEKAKALQDNSESYTVINKSNQMITLNLRAPASVGDFFLGEQTVYIKPGKKASIPVARAYKEQIANLQKKGFIKATKA